MRRAWTFLWDPAEPDLRLRIGGAFCLMIGAKLTAIQVPFLFKFAIDALSEPATRFMIEKTRSLAVQWRDMAASTFQQEQDSQVCALLSSAACCESEVSVENCV